MSYAALYHSPLYFPPFPPPVFIFLFFSFSTLPPPSTSPSSSSPFHFPPPLLLLLPLLPLLPLLHHTHTKGIRESTTVAALKKLKPAFLRGGSATAGNSSQVMVQRERSGVWYVRRSIWMHLNVANYWVYIMPNQLDGLHLPFIRLCCSYCAAHSGYDPCNVWNASLLSYSNSYSRFRFINRSNSSPLSLPFPPSILSPYSSTSLFVHSVRPPCSYPLSVTLSVTLQVSDGAAAVLVARASFAASMGLPVLGIMRSYTGIWYTSCHSSLLCCFWWNVNVLRLIKFCFCFFYLNHPFILSG